MRNEAESAFSLLELLATVAIVGLVLSISVPALNGLISGSGRKGAVNLLMNTLEDARISALERSSPTYVGFADRNFPDAGSRYRKFLIFRESDPETDPSSSSRYIPVSKWMELPKGISIKSEESSLVGSGTGGQVTFTSGDAFPGLPQGGALACIKFNSMGSIELPLPDSLLQLFVYEGYFADDRDTFTKAALYSTDALFEKIVLSRYTGRARNQVATTKSQE